MRYAVENRSFISFLFACSSRPGPLLLAGLSRSTIRCWE